MSEARLLDAKQLEFNEEAEIDDILPPSSRVKKILKWNRDQQAFDIEPPHKQELQQIIGSDSRWTEFEKLYTSLPPEDHQSNRTPSLLLAILLWTCFGVILILLLYVLFIILQLALFNLIMLVVLCTVWWRACKISKAIITRVLGKGRKKPFKKFVYQMRSLEWLQALKIEIQENEEGKWIEVHLSESVDDAVKSVADHFSPKEE